MNRMRLNVQWYATEGSPKSHSILWQSKPREIRFTWILFICGEEDFQLFNWEHLRAAQLTAKWGEKAIKNAKFIQAYGFQIEQMTKHCNRLCWTMESIQLTLSVLRMSWLSETPSKSRLKPTKNQWQLEKDDVGVRRNTKKTRQVEKHYQMNGKKLVVMVMNGSTGYVLLCLVFFFSSSPKSLCLHVFGRLSEADFIQINVFRINARSHHCLLICRRRNFL